MQFQAPTPLLWFAEGKVERTDSYSAQTSSNAPDVREVSRQLYGCLPGVRAGRLQLYAPPEFLLGPCVIAPPVCGQPGIDVADVEPGQAAPLTDVDDLRRHRVDGVQIAHRAALPHLVGQEDEDRAEVAEAFRDVHRLVRQPQRLLAAADGAVLVDDERLHAAEVPQRALALEHLRGPQAHPHAVDELGVPHVVDRLQVQDVGEGALVAGLLGHGAPLAEHRRRGLVVPAQAQRPPDRGHQPGPVRAHDVPHRGQGALGHLDGFRHARGPGQLVDDGPRQPAERVGPAELLVEVERTVHRAQSVVPAADAAQRQRQPLEQLGAGPRSSASISARACSNWETASSKAAASNARAPAMLR